MTNSARPVALVTGAGGGLGAACCAALESDGYLVAAADLDIDAAKRAIDGLPECAPVQLDVSDRASVEAVTDHLVRTYGRIDALINMAGVARNQMLHKVVDADFELVLRTHLGGTLNTMRAAAPVMKQAGYGRIVNFSSIAVRGSLAGSAYGAAKGGIEALTRSAAIELARYGVTANCVAPGVIAAGLFLTVPEEYRRERIERVPLGRLGTAEEVAAAVSFFASPKASYVTGQTLFVCGGLSIGI